MPRHYFDTLLRPRSRVKATIDSSKPKAQRNKSWGGRGRRRGPPLRPGFRKFNLENVYDTMIDDTNSNSTIISTSSNINSHRKNNSITAGVQRFNLKKIGPAPGRVELSKGHVEVNVSNGSGMFDSQFEIV